TVTFLADEGASESGLVLHVRASTYGLTFDTVDLATLAARAVPDETVRQSFSVPAHPRFVKVLVENLDAEHSAENVEVIATIGG
ncbi:MAG: hypothetical protein ACR2NU_14390, partial [Aeoliella sp.]